MARFEMDFGVQSDLFESFEFGPIAMKALNAAAPIQIQATQAALRSAAKDGGGRMVASVKANAPKKASNGAYIVHVRPTGTDSTRSDTGGTRSVPVRNMAKAAYLEYGVAGRQPARPWAQSATSNAQGKVDQILEQTITEEVTKALGGS